MDIVLWGGMGYGGGGIWKESRQVCVRLRAWEEDKMVGVPNWQRLDEREKVS